MESYFINPKSIKDEMDRRLSLGSPSSLHKLFDQTLFGSDISDKGFPHYNLIQVGGDDRKYRIEVALAGFSPDDLSVELDGNTLCVSSNRSVEEDDSKDVFVHKGIANRSFVKKFTLAKEVKVSRVDMKNGMLFIDLEKVAPKTATKFKIGYSEGTSPSFLTE